MTQDFQGGIPVTIERPTFAAYLLQTTSNIAIPVFSIKFEPNDEEDFLIKVRVSKKILEFMKKYYITDDTTAYFSTTDGQLGFWGLDMIAGLKILSNLGIIDNLNNWVMSARKSLNEVLSKNETESKKSDSLVYKRCQDFLNELGILKDIAENEILKIVMKQVISSKKMDSQTIIYRVALGIYHAKSATGVSVTKLIDSPSDAYIRLLQTKFYSEEQKAFSPMEDLPLPLRAFVTKVIIVFAVAAFVYYRETGS